MTRLDPAQYDYPNSAYQAACDEIGRLRAALEGIAHPAYGLGFNKLRGLARTPLSPSAKDTPERSVPARDDQND